MHKDLLMKYLYVLVNSTTGFYTEQTYVSMLSLRHVTPDAFISLLVDDKTANIQGNHFFESIKSLVNEYKVISLPSDMPAIERSRFIKTSMREHTVGDFLFIDSDTIWASPIDREDFTFDIMGVLDAHKPFSPLMTSHKFVLDYFDKMDCHFKQNFYINSGILYSKDSVYSKNFFKKWHEKWKETSKSGIFVDQPSLNYIINNEENPEKFLLLGEYNAQISNSWRHFPYAKIIHYFTFWEKNKDFNSPYLLQNINFWENVRKEGISKKIIEKPLAAFGGEISISLIDDFFEKSALYGFVKDLYKRKKNGQRSKFDILEKLLKTIGAKNS